MDGCNYKRLGSWPGLAGFCNSWLPLHRFWYCCPPPSYACVSYGQYYASVICVHVAFEGMVPKLMVVLEREYRLHVCTCTHIDKLYSSCVCDFKHLQSCKLLCYSLSLSRSPSLPQVVIQADPDLVALHCQEVGGKDFEICMPKVKDFIKYALSVPYHSVCRTHQYTHCTPLCTTASLV